MEDIFKKYIKEFLKVKKVCEEACDGENKDCEKCKIINAHTTLRKELRERLFLMEEVESDGGDDIYSFLTGSYKRGTQIRPPKDAEFFNVFKADSYKDFTPSEMLNILYAALVDIYPEKEKNGQIIVQTHSINVQFEDGFGIDVIPAFEDGELYRIPHVPEPGEGDESWLISNPKIHEEVVRELNKKTGGMFVPLVRLIKAWRRDKCKPIDLDIKSFLLEILAAKIFENTAISSYSQGLATFFSEASNYLNEPCIKDPANKKNYIDDYLTNEDREQFKALVEHEAEIIRQAMEKENDSDHQQSLNLWQSVFTDSDFAEAGNKVAAEEVKQNITSLGLYSTSVGSVLSTGNENEQRQHKIPRSSSWGE